MSAIRNLSHFQGQNGSSLSEKIALWQNDLLRVPGVAMLPVQQWPRLRELLAQEDDADSYLTSVAYYLFTGRKGLWVYRHEAGFVLFCWHPNIPGKVLIFPPRGRNGHAALQALLGAIPQPPLGLCMARVKELQSYIPFDVTDEASVSFAPVVENVMDWKYPARVLSSSRVAGLEGVEFHKIRNRIRQITKKRQDIRLERLGAVAAPQVREFISEWIAANAANQIEAAGLNDFYGWVMDAWDLHRLPLDGRVCFMNGKIEALVVWDVSNCAKRAANRFVNLCNRQYKGLADFMMHQTAQCLHEQGVGFINLGGSETAHLDSYKSKYAPAYSVVLQSVEIHYYEEDAFVSARRSVSAVAS